MTLNEYQELALRTAMEDKKQQGRIVDSITVYPELSQVIIAALKLNSESGELSDALVKHLSYGQPLDIDNIVEECGDLMWYIALILTKFNASMQDCMSMNIEKLRIRYPEQFTERHAIERLDKVVKESPMP